MGKNKNEYPYPPVYSQDVVNIWNLFVKAANDRDSSGLYLELRLFNDGSGGIYRGDMELLSFDSITEGIELLKQPLPE